MLNKISRILKDESGITALETAIILIAFIVVASVFAFTILSAGTFSTERGREAIYAGLEEVQSSLEVAGIVHGTASTIGYTGTIDSLVFTVQNAAGGNPIDVTAPSGQSCSAGTGCSYSDSNHVLVLDYRDENQYVFDIPWTREWAGDNDGDTLLEEGEQLRITVPITASSILNSTGLGVNTVFQLEVKPPRGGVLMIARTSPAYINTIQNLD